MKNWNEVQRLNLTRVAKTARAVMEINRSYQQRADIINGWQGSGGELLQRYVPKDSNAMFGIVGNNGNRAS